MNKEEKSAQVQEIGDRYKSKMMNELQKFLNVYNDIAGSTYMFDVRGQYDMMIRILGNYISTVYSPDTWLDTKLQFSEEVVIEFEVFRGTAYEEKVALYLQSLRRAFDESLDQEISQFLQTTQAYTEEEKNVCREFFNKMTELHRQMKNATFKGALDADITSTTTIDQYKETLREFNQFMTFIASNRTLNALIQRFDSDIRQIAVQKRQVEIVFDV